MLHALTFAPGITSTGEQLMCGLAALALIGISIRAGHQLRTHHDYDEE